MREKNHCLFEVSVTFRHSSFPRCCGMKANERTVVMSTCWSLFVLFSLEGHFVATLDILYVSNFLKYNLRIFLLIVLSYKKVKFFVLILLQPSAISLIYIFIYGSLYDKEYSCFKF